MSHFIQENSYSNILRRLSAFGGVQLFNILINVIRGKFVAIFLGPTGMGISSLYLSSTTPIQLFSSLGINMSIVKEIAANKHDGRALRRHIIVALRMILFTSILGALICGCAAPLWSHITFGDSSHTLSYIWLSVFVALSVAGMGFLAILQGLGIVKQLAKASLIGGLTGLLFGVPMYYFWGFNGIVPAMIILALSTFLFYGISLSRHIRDISATSCQPVTFHESMPLVRRLLALGIILLVGSLVGQCIGYAINLYIRTFGSIADVGLYNSANSITNQYIGILFSALALDYFPRLSACSQDIGRMATVVNRQINLVMLVGTPLVILLILTAPFLIKLLLSEDFIVIVPLIRWMGLGILFQLFTYPLGYIYVAREDRKVYIWLECIWGNVCWLACSIGFYHWQGLIGLGMSLVVRGLLSAFIDILVCRRRYGFTLSVRGWHTVMISLLLCGGAFALSALNDTISYAGMGVLLVISVAYSFTCLRRLLNTSSSDCPPRS